MKYIKQAMIIFTISLIGEILNKLLPLPVPASVYGLVILLTLLLKGVIKKEEIKETANFLIETMPIMFLPPAIRLMQVWPEFKEKSLIFLLIILVTTLFVMTSSGKVTDLILKRGRKK